MEAVVLAVMLAGGHPGTSLAVEVAEGLVVAVVLGGGGVRFRRRDVRFEFLQEEFTRVVVTRAGNVGKADRRDEGVGDDEIALLIVRPSGDLVFVSTEVSKVTSSMATAC